MGRIWSLLDNIDKEIDTTEEKLLPRVLLEIRGSKGQIPGFLNKPGLETNLSTSPVAISRREGISRGDRVISGLHPGSREVPRNIHFERETLEGGGEKQTFAKINPADISKTKRRGE